MKKEKLKKVFAEIKKAVKLNFCLTYPDALGDCQIYVLCAIADKYGTNSRGIWLKHWTRGRNAKEPVDELKRVYIAHDLTEVQAKQVFDILSKYYTIESGKYDPTKCIIISEKE